MSAIEKMPKQDVALREPNAGTGVCCDALDRNVR
jgi:hypothetical protein